MAEKKTVLFIGCGNMGAALAGGYARRHPETEVVAIDRDPARASSLLPSDSGVRVYSRIEDVADVRPSIVVLALKPQVLGEALGGFLAVCRDALVVSIAAGASLARLAQNLGSHRRLVRAMPNLPVVVGQGMSTLYGEGLSESDRELASALFAAVGEVAWVNSETQIDLATAVAGSGPAYFFAIVDHLAQAGVANGLAPELAARLARQTCIGAASLMANDARSAGELRAAVCSPGGTTEAGLAAMEHEGALPGILANGVAAAYARAGELAD
ncbi:pyrroline-5-carboxylate reductase [Azonexus sp. IMCC34839]|uniref:pyrroline-5-carboxylate reductase n=1 Tax=Azonexus sp. IMCC34839 TaxID=3133695 RepID=UPI003999B7FA